MGLYLASSLSLMTSYNFSASGLYIKIFADACTRVIKILRISFWNYNHKNEKYRNKSILKCVYVRTKYIFTSAGHSVDGISLGAFRKLGRSLVA